jgi:transcriptional regulator with XRE-family HTH domain
LIRNAREEKRLSQAELAEKLYTRQASISAMENGKMEPSASELMLLAHLLDKPILYFFPKQYWIALQVEAEELTPDEQALIMEFRQIKDEYQRIILSQIRALAEVEQQERDKENEPLFNKYMERRKKK